MTSVNLFPRDVQKETVEHSSGKGGVKKGTNVHTTMTGEKSLQKAKGRDEKKESHLQALREGGNPGKMDRQGRRSKIKMPLLEGSLHREKKMHLRADTS